MIDITLPAWLVYFTIGYWTIIITLRIIQARLETRIENYKKETKRATDRAARLDELNELLRATSRDGLYETDIIDGRLVKRRIEALEKWRAE